MLSTVIIHNVHQENAARFRMHYFSLWNDSYLYCSDTVTHAYTLDVHSGAYTVAMWFVLYSICVCLFICVCVFLCRGGGWWLQIVLGPVDPSQSERSCLSSSALDSCGTLIRLDSQPQEMMGRETAHSAHVTLCAGTGGPGRRVGVLDGMEN